MSSRTNRICDNARAASDHVGGRHKNIDATAAEARAAGSTSSVRATDQKEAGWAGTALEDLG